MIILDFTLAVFAGSVTAGLLGALTGLGGGVVLIPLLTLLFKADIRYAMGASLIAGHRHLFWGSGRLLKEGFSNIRIGMFLEVATTLGALGGALLAAYVPIHALAFILGVVLLGSAYLSRRPRSHAEREVPPDALATRLRMNGTFPEPEGIRAYNVTHVPLGFALMLGAGALSGLLGIGSGAMKVLAMDRAMRIPFKVSTTTSNFMIGVTAAASAGVYLGRGYIDPGLAMPVVLGVLAGSAVGTRILTTAAKWLRLLFSVVIAALGVEMIIKGMQGSP